LTDPIEVVRIVGTALLYFLQKAVIKEPALVFEVGILENLLDEYIGSELLLLVLDAALKQM